MVNQYTTKFSWTEEGDAELRRLCAARFSFREMAAALSSKFGKCVSRSAVAGRCHRKKLSNGRPSNHLMQKMVKREKAPKARPEQPRWLTPLARKKFAASRPAALRKKSTIIDPATRVGIVDHRDGQCRWPVDEVSRLEPFVTYCGGPVASKDCPYCVPHWRMSRRGYIEPGTIVVDAA